MLSKAIEELSDSIIKIASLINNHPYTVLKEVVKLSGMDDELKRETMKKCKEYLVTKQTELPWKVW